MITIKILKKINILNNQRVKDEMAREIRKYFDIKDNESTIHQSLWDVAKAVLVVGIYSLIFLLMQNQ